MRRGTGYGRLADENGFAIVYANGYEGSWNGCNIAGDYSANRLNIDDVGFLGAVADKLVTELGVDPGRVFATGVSRGAAMALRLARWLRRANRLEEPAARITLRSPS